jgi:prepilin-type processing-associated H-X9-DG protein
MRIANRIICSVAVAFAASAPLSAFAAAADINKFIDEKTALVGQADLSKVDAPVVKTFLHDLAKAAGMFAAEPPAPGSPEVEMRAGLDQAFKWVDDVKKAGATDLLIAASAASFQDPPSVIIAVPDAKADAVIALLPLPKPAPGRPANPRMPTAEKMPGVGVIVGTPRQLTAVKAIKPAARTDLATALKSAGNAPIRLAFAPEATLRQMMAQNMPPQVLGKPSTLLHKDLQWAVAFATPPSSAAGAAPAAAKLIVQSTDANSAKQTDELLVAAILMNQRMQSKLPDAAVTLLTPQVQGSQLVTSLDAKQMNELAVAMREPVARARQQAMRVRSMSNMRQILMTCMMSMNENKGQWPADMKALEAAVAKYARGQNAKMILANPNRPGVAPAYVYIKPAQKQPDPQTVVLYESHKEFGEGVNVGFADGHVEFINRKERFDELLAKQAQ